MNIGPTGIWLCEDTKEHTFDKGLFREIVCFCDDAEVESVVDLGCGSGDYVAGLNQHNILTVGFDGNPSVWKFNANCHQQDLAVEFRKGKFDLVLSLEVGEHIPQPFEHIFLDNIAAHALKHVILSWFPRPGEGIGHVNERPNWHVIQEMQKRGFLEKTALSVRLREAADNWWFKESLMVFSKNDNT